MVHQKHIQRLAALISEDIDEYAGLEDADEFAGEKYHGNNCGRDCWEYEAIPITVDGQLFPMCSAELDYDADISFEKYVPATRYSPEEGGYSDVGITGCRVTSFAIEDNGVVLAKWHQRAGKRHRGVGTQSWDAGFVDAEKNLEPVGPHSSGFTGIHSAAIQDSQTFHGPSGISLSVPLSDDALQSILAQIKDKFEEDEEQVIEWIHENVADEEQGDGGGGSWD